MRVSYILYVICVYILYVCDTTLTCTKSDRDQR